MGCCDHDSAAPSAGMDYSQLPEQTFCCMARVIYTTAVAAEEMLCGRKHPSWHSLNERQKLDLASDARRFLTEGYEGPTPLSRLMAVLLRAMTSAT